jgi:hypothetical protein
MTDSIEANFKSETKTITFLMKAFFFFIHLGIMTEFVAAPKFRHAIRLIFFIYLSQPYYKTIKHRYYTYWSFSLGFFIYLLFKINEQFFNLHQPHIGALYTIAILMLISKMYILSSPIYYPRVNWWEYDFRFRDDLKIKVKINEEEIEARLTDLRRQAGCVALFPEVNLGKELIISAAVGDESVLLRGLVMSRRRELIGRPFIYGIQFKFDNRRNKKRYVMLEKLWKREKNNKRKKKFAHVV